MKLEKNAGYYQYKTSLARLEVSYLNNPSVNLATAQSVKFSIKDFFSKCEQICNFLRIWSHLLKKSLTENFFFCAEWSLSKRENISSFQSNITFLYPLKTSENHRFYQINLIVTKNSVRT